MKKTDTSSAFPQSPTNVDAHGRHSSSLTDVQVENKIIIINTIIWKGKKKKSCSLANLKQF